MKIFEARQFNNEITETIDVESKNDLQISIITNNKTYLAIKCSDGFLELLTVQLEGKKRMSIEEFLRGYKFIS